MRLVNNLKTKMRELSTQARQVGGAISGLFDLTLQHQTRSAQTDHPNPLNRYGKKCFSQADEDGLTLEILKRIDCLKNGVYVEFGVGDGTENNTLILASLGWKGFWVGGDTLRISVDPNSDRFAYLRDWITLDNILPLQQQGLSRISSTNIDVISLDLDGNDIYFAEKLLASGLEPKLFIVEYNGKFPPPVEFQIVYDAKHSWKGDDYFGASLTSFAKLFERFGYRLVCCNSHSGANAFFVHGAYSAAFADVPADIEKIYVGPRYFMYRKFGHPQSIRTIEQILGSHPAQSTAPDVG
ncbi:hypothetical protein J7E62_27980 [Variovorax paradoxus]|nr:hypothetical protein [Variovorax paradoxus]